MQSPKQGILISLIAIAIIVAAAFFFTQQPDSSTPETNSEDITSSDVDTSPTPAPTPEPNAPSTAVSLANTSWNYNGGQFTFTDDSNYVVNFGCNTMGGTYSLTDSEITLSPGLTTLIACPEDLAGKEQTFGTEAALISRYEQQGENILLSGEGVSMLLTPPSNLDLTDAQWNVVSIKEGNGIVSAAIDRGSYITLNTDGTFSGASACNSFGGSYTAQGGEIVFSEIFATERACEQDRMDRERILLESLEGVTEYSIDRNELQLQSPDDTYRLNFTAAE